MPAPRRKERTFRLPDDFSLSNFTDEELRSRYRFGRESIEFLSELLRDDIERDTSRNHALSTTVQVLVALRFFASGSFLQVIGDTLGLSKSSVSRIIGQVSLALHRNKETSSSGHRPKRRYFKINAVFLPRGDFLGWLAVLTALTSRFRHHMKTKTVFSIVKGSIPWMCKQFAITKVGKILKCHN